MEAVSLDEFISRAKEAGGKVVLERQGIPEGTYALMADQQGNGIGIWEAKT
jgi:predicted enzyme related to lactoylglutathione lyase